MGQPLDVTASTPRRQSCDRCHGQKLRCTRPDSRKSGACERCLRKGARCVYSSSLPKGRPSLYRLSEVAPPPAPTAAAAGTTATTEATPRSPGSATATTNSASSTVLGATPRNDNPESPGATSPFPNVPGTPVSPQTGGECAQFGDDAGQGGIISPAMDQDLHMCHNQGGALDLYPHAADSFAGFWPSWWHDDPVGDSMVGIIPSPVTPPFPIDPALAVQAALPSRLDEVFTTEIDGGAVVSYVREDVQCQESQDAGYRPDSMATRGSHVDGGSAPISSAVDDNGFELIIVRLSRLSTRLSQLLGSSRSFLAECMDPSSARPFECGDDSAAAAAAAPGQLQLGIEAVFKSVNNWLVQGSSSSGHHFPADSTGALQNPFDLLQHMFSAYNHLLEIMRDVRAGTARTSAAPSPMTATSGSSSSSSSASCPTVDKGGSHHASSIVRQLIMVCVTLLLNMYVAILIALQRSADELSSRQGRRQQEENQQQQQSHTHTAAAAVADAQHHQGPFVEVPQGGGGGQAMMHDAERVHLQLVTVVQLCAYFIRRQNQTLDMLVRGEDPSGGDGGEQAPRGGGGDGPGGVPYSSLDAVGELQAEVEQRLRKVQDSLCMVI